MFIILVGVCEYVCVVTVFMIFRSFAVQPHRMGLIASRNLPAIFWSPSAAARCATVSAWLTTHHDDPFGSPNEAVPAACWVPVEDSFWSSWSGGGILGE